MTSHGFIVIADLSGYTVYLNESELEHAKDTIGLILELVVDRTSAPLTLN